MDEADLVSDGRPDPQRQWDTSMPPRFGRVRAELYAVASVALWGCAAALALAAPFLQLFVVDVPSRSAQAETGVDGWGRVGAALGPRTHEPRFGIGLWACALALAWLAARRGRAMYRTERDLDLVAAGAAVGVPSALAGVTLSLVLFVENYGSRLSGLPARGGGQLDVRWSWGLGLSLASLVLAATGSYSHFRAFGRDRPD